VALLLLPLVAGCSLDEGKAGVTAQAGVTPQTQLVAYEPTTSSSELSGAAPTLLTTTTTLEAPTTTDVVTTSTKFVEATTTTELGPTTTTLLPGSTTTTTPAPTATVLYEIDDWSTGLNGWGAAGQWKTVAGMLVTDGSDNSIAVAPISLGEYRDYAVECEIQVLYPASETAVYLVARLVNGVGYWGGHNGQDGVNAIGFADERVADAYFTLDGGWHTYRFEVRDNTMKLYFEDAEVARAMDNRALEAGTVGIYCGSGQINVRAFRVITL
jgi:hypothetical protein